MNRDKLKVAKQEMARVNINILGISAEKAMATHSSTLAWRILWTEESSRLQSLGLHRARHDLTDLAAAAERVSGLK